MVLSPHQNNFEVPLRIEEWDGRPPEDDAQWRPTTPGDARRIRLWPSAEDVPDRRIKEWHPPESISDQVP